MVVSWIFAREHKPLDRCLENYESAHVLHSGTIFVCVCLL